MQALACHCAARHSNSTFAKPGPPVGSLSLPSPCCMDGGGTCQSGAACLQLKQLNGALDSTVQHCSTVQYSTVQHCSTAQHSIADPSKTRRCPAVCGHSGAAIVVFLRLVASAWWVAGVKPHVWRGYPGVMYAREHMHVLLRLRCTHQGRRRP